MNNIGNITMNTTKPTINIIDDQPDFIIVNKPANANFHDEGELGLGFFNAVNQQFNSKNNTQNNNSKNKLTTLYPVHRLDKMTSGLLIFAKNKTAATQFQQLFEQHKVQKFYLAISDKKPKKKQGLIKGDMAKSRRSTWKLLRTQINPAISQFMSYSVNNGLRLYVVKPHSGKTHQIRVALSSVGSPIIGDALYSPNIATETYDRGYLHAYALQFTLNNINYEYQLAPDSGQYFICPSLIKKLEEIGKPWNLSWPSI